MRTRNRWLARAASLWLAGLAVGTALWGQTAAGSGQLNGRVVNPAGQGVARAFVTVSRSGAGAGGRAVQNGRTAADGSFAFPGLPAGSYRACVQVVGSELIDPCRWTASPPSATVVAGQSASMGTITLKKGVMLRVRLIDGQGVLAAAGSKGRKGGVPVLAGVWLANGLFQPLKVTSRRGGNWDHDLLVPAGASLRVTVSSPEFEMADDKGGRVDPSKGAAVPVQVAALGGGAPLPVVFRVTGLKGRK